MTYPAATPARATPPLLPIRCTSTACEVGLHCFKATQRLRKQHREGECRACGVQLIDWDRVHSRRLDDIGFTFAQLRLELVRHHFWHLEFDQKAINHAVRKGRRRLFVATRHRLERSVGTMSAYDGRQTPWRGNTIYYAQHAVAACCRTCIEYWHGIPKGPDLSSTELDYLYGLVIRYLNERLPDLPADGQKVPPLGASTTA